MKRFFAILLSVLMVVSVLAIVASCNGKQGTETTAADATTTVTDKATTAADTTATEKDTTAATTTATEKDTTAATTTATEKDTTAATTTATEKDTTAATTTATETQTTTVQAVETTTLPVFARFDFGTKTYAEHEGLTSHEYLTSALFYDSTCLMVEYYDDYWDIWTSGAYDSDHPTQEDGMKNMKFALAFNDLVTFDFDDEIVIGYGGYNGTPYKSVEELTTLTWSGRHQFMQVRIVNNTTNNIWGIRYCKVGDSTYYTSEIIGNLYLQGGEPTAADDYRRTCTPTTEWATYTYDMFLTSGLASGRGQSAIYISTKPEGPDNWFDYKQYVYSTGNPGGTNIVWNQGKTLTSLEFNFFSGVYTASIGSQGDMSDEEWAKWTAAQSNIKQACDTRANIKAGMNVKVDYIIFGCSQEQLDSWQSYMEQNS